MYVCAHVCVRVLQELKSKIALDCRVPYDNVKMGHAGSLDHFSAGVLGWIGFV